MNVLAVNSLLLAALALFCALETDAAPFWNLFATQQQHPAQQRPQKKLTAFEATVDLFSKFYGGRKPPRRHAVTRNSGNPSAATSIQHQNNMNWGTPWIPMAQNKPAVTQKVRFPNTNSKTAAEPQPESNQNPIISAHSPQLQGQSDRRFQFENPNPSPPTDFIQGHHATSETNVAPDAQSQKLPDKGFGFESLHTFSAAETKSPGDFARENHTSPEHTIATNLIPENDLPNDSVNPFFGENYPQPSEFARGSRGTPISFAPDRPQEVFKQTDPDNFKETYFPPQK